MDKFYITTPIYYVNDNPHIGHAYTTVAADVLARWYRLLGLKVYFLTGTDEHGQKIFEAAKSKDRQPKGYCDEIVEVFKSIWKKLNISCDNFIRTTDVVHEDTVKKVLNELYNRDEIYKAKYKGSYCVQCEKFIAPGELADGLCPYHKIKPIERSEENYFFKLSNYREKLIEIISDESHPEHFKISPEGRKKEIIGKLKTGLEDISISRASMPWGIPLPFDSSQTTYVWVDALLNYLSGIGYVSGKSDFAGMWPAEVHLMAKDILWFHSVIWPAILVALKLPLPKRVYAHGFFTVNGQKMSKTIGNVIEP
jgi:methionyl-tRNA synthetase